MRDNTEENRNAAAQFLASLSPQAKAEGFGTIPLSPVERAHDAAARKLMQRSQIQIVSEKDCEGTRSLYGHTFLYQKGSNVLQNVLRAAAQHNLTLIPVPALGACFYACLAIHSRGTIAWQHELRAATVLHMWNNMERYIKVVTKYLAHEAMLADSEEEQPPARETLDDLTTFEWYMTRAARHYEDVRTPELLATAERLGVVLCINDMRGRLLRTLDSIGTNTSSEPAAGRCYLLRTGRHFDLLMPQAPLVQGVRLQQGTEDKRTSLSSDETIADPQNSRHAADLAGVTTESEYLAGEAHRAFCFADDCREQANYSPTDDYSDGGDERSERLGCASGWMHGAVLEPAPKEQIKQTPTSRTQPARAAKRSQAAPPGCCDRNNHGSSSETTTTAHQTPVPRQQEQDEAAFADQVHRTRVIKLLAYGRSYTDGGSKVVIDPKTQTFKRIASYGVYSEVLVNGNSQAHVRLGLVLNTGEDERQTNNVAEFTAVLKSVQQAALLGIRHWDIRTDSEIFVKAYQAEETVKNSELIKIMQEIKEFIREASIVLTVEWVKAHHKTVGNNKADALATEARSKRLVEIKRGPLVCDTVQIPRRVTLETAMGARIRPRYQTYAPYQPFDPDLRASRRVEDLVTEQNEILYICPACEPLTAKRHVDKKGLLRHLREAHGSTAGIPAEIEDLFDIVACPRCNQHYANSGLKQHQNGCMGISFAPRNKIGQTQAMCPDVFDAPGYQQFEDALLDHIADTVSYSDIFASQDTVTKSIIKPHYRAQPLYTACLAVTLEGINSNSGKDPETHRRQSAWLKLLLLLPRLVLHSSRDVAKRARLYLKGTMEAFQQLSSIHADLVKQIKKTKEATQQYGRGQRSAKKVQDRLAAKASELVKNYELSRALRMLQRTSDQQGVDNTPEVMEAIGAAYPDSPECHRVSRLEPRKCHPATPGHPLFTMAQLKQAIKQLSSFAGTDLTEHRAGHWKPAFRGQREMDSWERRTQEALRKFIETTLLDPENIGDEDFWSFFSGAKITVIPSQGKLRSVGSQNFIFKVYSQILATLQRGSLKEMAGKAHLGGLKPSQKRAGATYLPSSKQTNAP